MEAINNQRTHFAVQLVLLLRDGNVILQRTLHGQRQVGVEVAPIRVQVEQLSMCVRMRGLIKAELCNKSNVATNL